jgi:hypothetical protein
MGAHLAVRGREIKALGAPGGRSAGASETPAENYSVAGLTIEQRVNIVVPQAAMDQIPSCIVLLWIKKGISL